MENKRQATGLIEAKEIQIELGRFHLGPLSFKFRTGQLYVLRGKNGSGKSSLLKAIAGRLKLKGGMFQNVPMPIGMIGLEHTMMENWSVIENWRFLLGLQSKTEQEIPRAIAHWQNHRMDQLSAGQKRKVEMQILSSFEFPLYLLDEAFNVLDQDSKIECEHLFQELLRKGSTLILTAHQETSFFSRAESILDL